MIQTKVNIFTLTY